jgi:hypothetical protein
LIRSNLHVLARLIVVPSDDTSLNLLRGLVGADSTSWSVEIDAPVSAVLVDDAGAENATLRDVESLTMIAKYKFSD